MRKGNFDFYFHYGIRSAFPFETSSEMNDTYKLRATGHAVRCTSSTFGKLKIVCDLPVHPLQIRKQVGDHISQAVCRGSYMWHASSALGQVRQGLIMCQETIPLLKTMSLPETFVEQRADAAPRDP